MKNNHALATKDIPFQPLWDYILIDPIINKVTPGGLHIPDNAKAEDTMKGLCVKAGPGAYRDDGTFVPNAIKEGDIVFHLARAMPFKVVINGHDYLCLSGRDCVAIVPRKEE